jgi:2-aminoethylphosphonate-pyruvate transaminase
LFTPGPVQIPAIVNEYLIDPPCNYHRQEGFRTMFAENQRDLKYLLGIAKADEYFVTILLASGTGTNESVMLALESLGKGLILRNGFFGNRLVSQCKQAGIPHAVFDGPDDRPLDPAAVDRMLAANPDIKWVYFVSHETRAGLVNPHVEISKVCKARGLVVGADAVSSAFAYPLHLEASGIDLLVTTTSKAVLAVPGLGLVVSKTATINALAAVQQAGQKSRGQYLDLVGEYDKQRKDMAPRFGQPVQLHAALRAACLHLREVGIENHMRRIHRQLDELSAHLSTLGVEIQVDPAFRSKVAVNYRLPPGMLYPEFSARMAAEGFYILYGIAEDPSLFQLCTMGDIKEEHIIGLKRAFSRVLATKQRAVG